VKKVGVMIKTCRCCGISESDLEDDIGIRSDGLCIDCYQDLKESGACYDCFAPTIQISCEEWLCPNCDQEELGKLAESPP
jgi:hypothetical protein